MHLKKYKSRRQILGLAAAHLGSVLGAFNAQAATQAFALQTPDGDPIRNFAIDATHPPARLSSLLVLGADKQAPILYEFFDYACPYCRVAYQELEVLLGPQAGFRLGLVHHPVLGENSHNMALMVQAAQSEFGDVWATKLHDQFMAYPAKLTPERAMTLAQSMSIDTQRLQQRMKSDKVRKDLSAQSECAVKLGLRMTPAFVLGEYAFVGWPGADAVSGMIRSHQTCRKLACR